MEQFTARVTRTKYCGDDIATIYFTLDDGSVLDYTSGQYVSVYIDGGSTPEGKAYSLSSAPHEATMSITVKRVGEYSGYLYQLRPSDTFVISAAYGHFNPLSSLPLVGISAGVGVSPILSVIKDHYHASKEQAIALYCSNKSADAIPHFDEIKQLRDDNSLDVTHHVTRSRPKLNHARAGRIDAQSIVEKVGDEVMYLVCGSVDFVRSMYESLTKSGVAARYISTEIFFES